MKLSLGLEDLQRCCNYIAETLRQLSHQQGVIIGLFSQPNVGNTTLACDKTYPLLIGESLAAVQTGRALMFATRMLLGDEICGYDGAGLRFYLEEDSLSVIDPSLSAGQEKELVRPDFDLLLELGLIEFFQAVIDGANSRYFYPAVTIGLGMPGTMRDPNSGSFGPGDIGPLNLLSTEPSSTGTSPSTGKRPPAGTF